MPTSVKNDAVKDFEVEPRVRIGLDAMTPKERRIVDLPRRATELSSRT